MSRIRLLPEIVASQVAAGEVVERPASVVKELIENSIDAGARKIEIMTHRGGISLVRVIDDGSGMDRDDALLSLERHATSKIDVVRDAGEAPGTQVEVRSLFYNLPARRKFLRSENTESRNVEHQIHLQAIGHPRIAFTLLRDDRMLFQLPSAATLGDRIRDLYGIELLQRLVEVAGTASPKIRIAGFIGEPGLSRQTRSQQLVFVNDRAIESGLLTA